MIEASIPPESPQADVDAKSTAINNNRELMRSSEFVEKVGSQ